MAKDKKKQSWLERNMPTRESLSRHPLLRPFAPRFLLSELWRMNRRSVPRGVVIGIVAGLVVLVPGFQIFVAVLLCPFFRANIPVAAIATFINTPVTTPPLVYASYLLGQKLMDSNKAIADDVGARFSDMGVSEWANWIFFEAGPPVLLGLFVITTLAAATGYLLAVWLWTRWILRKRRRRSKKNAAGR